MLPELERVVAGTRQGGGRSTAALYDDEPVAAARIDAMLDVLEQDPGDQRVRKRSLRAEITLTVQVQGPLWGFSVRGRHEDYLVLWQPAEDDVEVRYIGPDI